MSFAEEADRILEGALAGLYKAGSIVMANSQPLVPVETGTLKRSGTVEQPVVDGDAASVTVGYGYGSEYEEKASGDLAGVGYGIYVHERLDLHHPHGQAKFLEQPAREFEADFPAVMQASIRERI